MYSVFLYNWESEYNGLVETVALVAERHLVEDEEGEFLQGLEIYLGELDGKYSESCATFVEMKTLNNLEDVYEYLVSEGAENQDGVYYDLRYLLDEYEEEGELSKDLVENIKLNWENIKNIGKDMEKVTITTTKGKMELLKEFLENNGIKYTID